MSGANLAYDFTQIYKQTYHHVAFSPGTQFILSAVQDRLIVRRSDTFQITRTWLVNNNSSASSVILGPATAPLKSITQNDTDRWITHIGWSADSEHILATCAKRGIVYVFKMVDDTWNATIEAGAEGLVKAEWAPDGRNVLCFSEWGLRVTIWSLVTGQATYIQYPKYTDKAYTFRKDGKYLVLAERHKSKDTLGVYDAHDGYKLARHVPLPSSSLSSLSLSPTGNHLAIWEGPLEYKLYILNLAGQLLATFAPEPEPALGIRNVCWHPSGSFLAVAGHDDKIHIISSLSWTSVKTLDLNARVPGGVNVWREPVNWLESSRGPAFQSYDRVQAMVSIPIVRTNPEKPSPKSGAVQLEWNLNGTLLMVRFDNAPVALHIYDFPAPSEPFNPCLRTVILHDHPILHARWNPVRSGGLSLSCGTRAVYTWNAEWEDAEMNKVEMAECIGIPAESFEVRDVRWSPDGRCMILLDTATFCCAFEAADEPVSEHCANDLI